LVTWESALMAKIMPYSWMGLSIYSEDNTGDGEIIDLASNTFVNGTFDGIAMPPTLALFLDKLAPVMLHGKDVKDGCVYIPLLDSTSPSSPVVYIGGNPLAPSGNLPNGVSQWSGRWYGLSTLSPVDLANGNLATYSFKNATGPEAPDGFYQFDLKSTVASLLTVGETDIDSNLNVNLQFLTPKFPPMTPDKTASVFLMSYNQLFNGMSANFATPVKITRGGQPVIGAVVRTVTEALVPITGDSQKKKLDGSVSKKALTDFYRYVSTRPTEAGNFVPMDDPMAALNLYCSFKVGKTLARHTFKVANPQDGDISLTMTTWCLINGGSPTAYMAVFQAELNRGYTPMVAVAAAFNGILENLFANSPVGIPFHQKNAILLIAKCVKRIKMAPYYPASDESLTGAQSWSDITKFFRSAWHFTDKYIVPVASAALPALMALL